MSLKQPTSPQLQHGKIILGQKCNKKFNQTEPIRKSLLEFSLKELLEWDGTNFPETLCSRPAKSIPDITSTSNNSSNLNSGHTKLNCDSFKSKFSETSSRKKRSSSCDDYDPDLLKLSIKRLKTECKEVKCVERCESSNFDDLQLPSSSDNSSSNSPNKVEPSFLSPNELNLSDYPLSGHTSSNQYSHSLNSNIPTSNVGKHWSSIS